MPTPAPTAAPTLAPTPGDIVQADSPVASNAAALVRRYLDALRSGNENAAYAALGGAPGDRGLALTEEQFIDASAKVTRIRAKQVGESSASVEAYVTTAKGDYFVTFHVGRASSGAVIETHDWIKP